MTGRSTAHIDRDEKVMWEGTVDSVQPRIRLMRSFDERSHSYLGYVLHLVGHVDGATQGFSVAIGETVYAKHLLRVGDIVSGTAAPVVDRRVEIAEYYKVAKLIVLARATVERDPPPWHVIAPPMTEYRRRGHRRLDARTYAGQCASCIYGCLMPVEIIVDQWDPGRKRYRQETFCYGPLSCSLYKAGPTRKVPGRAGMTWVEENWVDEETVAHRAPDE